MFFSRRSEGLPCRWAQILQPEETIAGIICNTFAKTVSLEPGVKEYLLRIVNTLSLGLLWMAVNSTAGIMYDLAFIHDRVTIGNILFYCWFLASLFFYLRWVIRLWKKPIDFEP